MKEHLPGDIIDILSQLRKVENIPFNHLYSLVEDCMDRYYMKVIQTLTYLMKNSFHDRQLVLVNTARVLKFLESYALRQTKLWKVLSKYHNLPDHFHDLKTALQTEFDLLKTATSKNVQNLQDTVQAQQAYTTVLSGHIVAIHTKLAHLDKYKYIVYTHTSTLMQYSSLPQIMTQTTNKHRCSQRRNDHNTICNPAHRSWHQPTTTHSDSQIIEPNNVQQQ